MPNPDAVVLVRQYRHPVGDYLWELPAGSIDPGEDAETAARRECHEELGLIAGAAERLGEAWPLPGYCTEYMTFFRLTGLRVPGADDAEAHQDEDEDIETQVFTLEQVRADDPQRGDHGPEDSSGAGAAVTPGGGRP